MGFLARMQTLPFFTPYLLEELGVFSDPVNRGRITAKKGLLSNSYPRVRVLLDPTAGLGVRGL